MSRDDQKTMDVAKPGESTPDTSSRPVIVSHRPVVQDPMMKNGEKTADETSETPKKSEPMARSDKVIAPLSQENKSETEEPEDAKEHDTEQTPGISESATLDAVADQAETSSKKKDNEKSAEEKAKQEKIQKLIAEKKYFVPIGQAHRRRNNRRALVVLVLLLLFALAGGYAAVDAGIIQTNIKLPVDLIKNEKAL